MHPDVHNSIIHSGQDMKTTEVPSIDDWIEMWYIYTVECHSSVRDELLPFATTWMDLEIIMLSEISQKK